MARNSLLERREKINAQILSDEHQEKNKQIRCRDREDTHPRFTMWLDGGCAYIQPSGAKNKAPSPSK